MIRSIVALALNFRYLVVVLAGVLFVFGITQLSKMPVDVLPEYSPPFVEIQTEALGLSAEEVEQMITVPMEQDLLSGVAWLDVIRSESIPGLSSVLIYFEPGTDLYRARQMVSERLAQAAVGIPHVSKPPTMIQPTSSASRFMIVGLSSEKLSLVEMSVLARWTIGPRLLGVPGVANVAIWGNRDQQLQVLVDPKRLHESGVTLEQVVETTGNSLWVSSLSFLEASSPGTGGFIDTPNQRFGIWHVLPITSPQDLAKIPVDNTNFILGDIVEITEDHQPLIGDALINDQPNLMIVIEKLPGTSTIEVTKGVEEALASLRPGFTEIEFDATLFRAATYLEIAISNFGRTILISALLAVLLLGIFYRGWRTVLIIIVTIPMSLVAALLVLYLTGATLNAMVLAGLVLALGIIIDDAVVDVHYIKERLRLNHLETSPRSAQSIVLENTKVRGVLIYATLIILLTMAPFFFMDGVSGALIQPIAISYGLAVLTAMVVAVVVTPVLCLLFSIQFDSRNSPLVPVLQRGYKRLLVKIIQSPRIVYLAVVVVSVAGLAALPFLGRAPLIPSFRESTLVVQFNGTPATSRPEMDRILIRASQELRVLPGVSTVAGHVGRAVTGDKVVGINSAELWVGITPDADYDRTVAAIHEKIDSFAGIDSSIQTYILAGLNQPNQKGTIAPFTVRLYGGDHQTLLEEVEKLRQTVSRVNGVVDSRALLPIEEPNIEIEVDIPSAQRYGLKPGDVRRAAAALLSGIQVGSLFDKQKVFDVVVWGKPEIRQSLTDIRELLIDTPGGESIRLGDVADVRIASSPTVINREAISPYIDIGFDIRGRNVDTVILDVKKAIQGLSLPLEYHAEVQNDYASKRVSNQYMLLVGSLAVFGIFLLLHSATRNWRLALVILLVLPLMLAGGLVVAALINGSLSIAALFGLFAVFGIGVRHTLLQIHHYMSLQQQDVPVDSSLVLQGSDERLAPMLMMVLTGFLTLLPFALFGDIPGNEIMRPLAIVIIGGLVTTTLFNLFFLPAFYLSLGKNREPELDLDDSTLQPIMAADD